MRDPLASHGCLLKIIFVMSQTFQKRAAEIADHAHNPKGALNEGADFLRGLDETERLCEFRRCKLQSFLCVLIIVLVSSISFCS